MTRFKSVPPTTTRTAVFRGLLVSLIVFVLLLLSGFGSGIWGLTEIAPRFAPPALDDGIWAFLGTVVTVGTPVALYLRVGLLAPVAVLIIEFFLWSLGSGAVWFFAVFLWPIYLILFLVFGGAEYFLRTYGALPSLPKAQ
jgi:hypothetical protein